MARIDLLVGAAAPTPPLNYVSLYAKTDLLFYTKDSTGLERLLAGTVSGFSFTNGSGFTGTVLNPTSTPALSLGTSVNGVLKGSGGALAAALNSDLPAMTATVGGAVPTPPNDAAKYLNGQGAWAVLGAITPTSVAIQGTAGAGFVSFPTQSSNPATPAAGTVTLFAANAPSGISRVEMITSTGAVLVFFRDSVDTVRNETGVALTKGQVVYINGANGTTSTVALARSNAAGTSGAIGIVLSASINNNAFGTVQRGGNISGVNTSAWTAGDTLWVSSAVAGDLTNVEPAAPNFGVKVGVVVFSSVGAGIISLQVQPFVASKNYASFGTLAVTGSATVGGDLTFSGSAKRIFGDFSNGTLLNRTMFQTSTVNGNTAVYAVPNGSGTTGSWNAFNAADPTNAAQAQIACSTTEVTISSSRQGVGTFLPLNFYTSGSLRATIATDGTFNFPVLGQRITADFSNATFANRTAFKTNTVNGDTSVACTPDGTAVRSEFRAYSSPGMLNSSYMAVGTDSTAALSFIESGRIGSGSFLPLTFYADGVERLRLSDLIIFPGTVRRIQGDFSNATVANRLIFQTSTVNNFSSVAAIPSGAGTLAEFSAFSGSDPDNSVFGCIRASGTEVIVQASKLGTASYGPLLFKTSTLTRAQITAAGAVEVFSSLGYGTTAGGTVTQITSKTTGVTLNKICGQIVTHNQSMTSETKSFTLTNSMIAATDTIIVNIAAGATADNYWVGVQAVGAGSCSIFLRCIGAALTEAITINFSVIKSVAA